jgi:tetratricopeptide (TPR) repeat protein
MTRAPVTLFGLLAALAVCAACVAQSSRGAGDDEAFRLFEAGNDLFADGDYEEAARSYRQLLNQGFRSEALHYNLGNASFRLGELGTAILQYEKASRIAPNDRDIQANLEFVRSLTVDKPGEADAQTTQFFMERLLDLMTPDQDAAIVSIFYLIGSGLIALHIVAVSPRSRRLSVWGLAAIALPLVLVSGILLVKIYRDQTMVHAVILDERVDVRSGPGDDNTALFTIHEGLKVRLRNEQGSWSQISLESGLNGWVPRSVFGKI